MNNHNETDTTKVWNIAALHVQMPKKGVPYAHCAPSSRPSWFSCMASVFFLLLFPSSSWDEMLVWVFRHWVYHDELQILGLKKKKENKRTEK